MKCLFGSLLLASCCALSSWSVSSGTLVINQSPDVSVTEGETVSISCCWKREGQRIRVKWMKNDVFNCSQESLQKETSECSNLTFVHITKEDSGRYTCILRVEIPSLRVYNGTGTVITVKPKNNTTEDTTSNAQQFPVIISLSVAVPLILIITIVCFCTIKKRQAALAARVIYEVPHMDSEEADMDKHSTGSSRGSTQWCQVPVYESVDYFQRVQDKEMG